MSPENVPPPIPPIPPSMPPAIPPMQSEQTRLVVNKISQKTGIFSKQGYLLLVTDKRLIFMIDNKTNINYMQQDPNLSLAENPANFAIPLESLERIEIYPGDYESNSPDSMVVKTAQTKMTFQIYDAYRVDQNLKQVLGSKVK